MATKTLNTRITLKADTTANWSSSTLVLLKGEMAIEIPESGEYKMKIGDGVNTFSKLSYVAMTPTEIKNLINSGAIQTVSLSTGTNNGTIAITVDGAKTDNIAVKGLGSAAYTNSNAYAAAGHGHAISGITGLQTALDGKSATGHIHDDRYYTETEINNKLANYLPAAGGTLTGALAAPNITASNYFTTPSMVGEGDLSTYYHRVDFGHSGVNQFDFYEYGGIYNFYQNQFGGKDKAILLGKITSNGWEGNVIGNLSGNAATATNASKVNNHTVNSDVPSGAKFTDTIYTHPSYTAKASGLYKVTVDGTGHVSTVTAVTKSDITALGIPGSDTNTWRPLGTTADTACAGNDSRLSNARPANGGNASTVNGHTVNADVPENAKFTDTTYSVATTSAAGLMSVYDKTNLTNVVNAQSSSYFTQDEINDLFS